jgi:hypothetical protein
MASQSTRQSELFAAEDWTVLYRAFTQINFNAYDPASINTALRGYIQANYPEEFNDWNENSEFVAIIDLLSWLAGSLAFRTDVNARENFLESAEARESVLRLARFLSYTPRRAQSARGLIKLMSVSTNSPLQDSFGVSLNNQTILWNDPDNPDWLEQFTIVLNSAFPTTNPFGIPLKTATLGTALTSLYRLNSDTNPKCVYGYTAKIDGASYPFEMTNIDIDADLGFFEREPDPSNGFHMVYRNDGRGNDSTRTGFFMLFKQGSLNTLNVGIANPIENRLIDVSTTGISETDIWTQTLNSDSTIATHWTKVPAIFSENITFNNISPEIRDIFSVITRDQDRVSLRFGDGRFGNVPVGDIRIWYRVVNGLQYQVRPRDMSDVTINIPYTDSSGRSYTLTMTFNLQENVNNAVGPEDLEQIRRRAPQVYGAQNRMVSGEDYNVFPLSSNNVIKMRAVNRVYSGHSRFLDINDPTSTYQDTVVYSDDGAMYKEDISRYLQVPVGTISNEQIVSRKIQPMLDDVSVRDYFNDIFVGSNPTYGAAFVPYGTGANPLVWRSTAGLGFNGRGYLQVTLDPVTHADPLDEFMPYFTTNALIKFRVTDVDTNTSKFVWAKVSSTDVYDYNKDTIKAAGSVVILNETIPDGSVIVKIIPPFRATLDSRAIVELNGESETLIMQNLIAAKRPFNLWYIPSQKSHLVYGTQFDIAGRWVAQDLSATRPSPDAILVMQASYTNGLYWAFEVLVGRRYIFESLKTVRWHDLQDHKVLDATTGTQKRDTIKLIASKLMPVIDANTGKVKIVNGNYQFVTQDINISFDIVDNVYDPDGYPVFKRIVVSPTDTDDDGSVDNPEAFQDVLALTPAATNGEVRLVKFALDTNSSFNSWVPLAADLQDGYGDPEALPAMTRVGVPNLSFQWKHYADNDIRIDPAITNIIDVFVLTSEYDFLVRQWIAAGSIEDDVPDVPSDLDLKLAFQDFEQYKMFSDQLVWRPVQYKYLFGNMAQDELKAQFKIVKLPNSTLSDGEIRSKVITTINDYFDVNKWEFGETFFFTELAAYIHLQLATAISSVALVPLSQDGKFGELFEIRSGSNEVFISTAQVSDIIIIDSNSMSNLRIS